MEYEWMWLPGFRWIIKDICGFTITRRRKSQVLQEETICKSELHCSRSLSKLKESFSRSCAKTLLSIRNRVNNMTKSKSPSCKTQVTRSGGYTPENQYVPGEMVLEDYFPFEIASNSPTHSNLVPTFGRVKSGNSSFKCPSISSQDIAISISPH